jgi:putative endonuclease
VTWQSLSMDKQYYVYIMSNLMNTVTYTGVTNDLIRRVYEHKNKLVEGFTKRYNINKLVYYEMSEDVESVILREKQIKSWSRRAKVNLINAMNPEWRDLSGDFYEG